MQTIFITSDTHFGHKNIIKYCNRPFSSVEEMDEALIDRWNKAVRPGDFVYHLGDFTFYRKPEQINAIARRLNGYIILIEGNHDHAIAHHPEARKWFTGIVPHMIVDDILLCHYPVHTKMYENHTTCGMKYNNLLYGHVHDKPVDDARSVCVCTELTGYTPTDFEYYVEKFRRSVNE